MQHRTRAILLLVCLFSVPGTASSSQKGVARRRGRKLEGYYNFDKEGNGNKQQEGSHDSYGEESYEGGGYGDGDSFGEHYSGYDGGSSSESHSSEGSSKNGGGDSFGEGSDSYSRGSDSDSYGSSSESYRGGSDSYSGGSSYGGSNSYGGGGYSGGSDSYSGYGGDSSSSSYRPPSQASAFIAKMNVNVPLIPVLLIAGSLLYFAMVFTAFMYQVHPESMFTNCCRISINTSRTAYLIGFNLYHCRLGDIPPIVCAMDDEDDLDDEEIARMKPRAGIDKALEIEHKKTMDRAITETKPEESSSKLPGFAKVFG
jgi:hypothetical protein